MSAGPSTRIGDFVHANDIDRSHNSRAPAVRHSWMHCSSATHKYAGQPRMAVREFNV